MNKVLVDRELLEQLQEKLDPHRDAVLWGDVCDALRRAQPAEAEGVSSARLMNTLAELARRAPLRTLHTICETQRQVSTVKLERYLEPVGDTLADYAFTLRIYFDKLSATLSAVTAERDRLLEELAATNRGINAKLPRRKFAAVGTGALYAEQNYCYRRGWKEGVAALRAQIRAAAMAAKEA